MTAARVIAIGALIAIVLARRSSAVAAPTRTVIPSAPSSSSGAIGVSRSGFRGTVNDVAQVGADLAGRVTGVPVVGQIAGAQASISPTSLVGGVVLGPIGTAGGVVVDLWDSIF